MHYFALAGDIVSFLEKQRSGEEEEGSEDEEEWNEEKESVGWKITFFVVIYRGFEPCIYVVPINPVT